jgi:hypothetical protein
MAAQRISAVAQSGPTSELRKNPGSRSLLVAVLIGIARHGGAYRSAAAYGYDS